MCPDDEFIDRFPVAANEATLVPSRIKLRTKRTPAPAQVDVELQITIGTAIEAHGGKAIPVVWNSSLVLKSANGWMKMLGSGG